MEETSVYDVSSRKDSVYDKIQQELSKYFKIKFNEIALEYEIFDTNSVSKIDFNLLRFIDSLCKMHQCIYKTGLQQ